MVGFKRNDVRRTILIITTNIPIPSLDHEAVVVVHSKILSLHQTTGAIPRPVFPGLDLGGSDKYVHNEPCYFLNFSYTLFSLLSSLFVFLQCVPSMCFHRSARFVRSFFCDDGGESDEILKAKMRKWQEKWATHLEILQGKRNRTCWLILCISVHVLAVGFMDIAGCFICWKIGEHDSHLGNR